MCSKKIEDIGEMGLLKRIEQWTKGSKGANPASKMELLLGIGDDCASLRCKGTDQVLISIDQLVEDVHFRNRYLSPEEIGYKALAVNISDIAAMGGIPTQALIGLAMPSHTPLAFVEGLYMGLVDTGNLYGIQIIGGDTVRSPGPIVITVTILGTVEDGYMIKRSGAVDGDRIMITGDIGKAMLGLEILEDSGIDTSMRICERFIHPIPRLKEARLLSLNRLATAMIDVSDGLCQDLFHICQQSGVGAMIERQSLPIDPDVKSMIEDRGKDPYMFALTGGEEYELLFTVRPEDVQRTRDLILDETGTQVHEIGRILKEKGSLCLKDEKENIINIDPCGFDHFRYGSI